MPPARTPPARPGLDIEQLGKMTAPFTVHVTRMRGSQRELVVMPAREGCTVENPSGGWTVADITTIDTEIAQVAGGGHFEIQILDSSAPSQHQRYTTHIPTEMYPSMTPKPYNPFDGSIPPAGGWGGWGAPPPPAWGWGGGGNGWGARTPVGGAAPPTDEATRLRDALHQQELRAQQERFEHMRRMDAAAHAPRDDGRLEREREERQRAEREADRARAEAAAAAAEARHRADIDALKAMMTQLAQAQATPKNDEMAQLRAEVTAERERNRAEQAIAEANRRTDALAAEMRQLVATMNARPTGPDPTMMMMIEMMKTSAEAARAAAQVQADAAREAARLQTEVAREEARARAEEARATAEAQARMLDVVTRATAAGNIPPVELIRMLKEASAGSDQMMRTVLSTTTDMLDLHRNATANLLSMQPQGEGVSGRIVGAIENAVGTFSEGQQKVAAANAAAQATVARAQADAMMAQAAIAQAQAGLAGPPTGASGASTPIAPFTPNPYAPPPAQPLPAGAAPPAADQAPAQATTQSAPPPPAPIRHGKTDEEWFGPALPQVKQLRDEVTKYLAAVEDEEVVLDQQPHQPIIPIVVDEASDRPVLDKDGKPVPIGASPFAAADFVVKAVGQIAQAQAAGQLPAGSIPAFDQLFAQQSYPALLDCILPDPVPQQFRVEVVRYLWRLLSGQPVHQDADPPLYGIEPFLKAAEAAEAEEAKAAPAAPANGTRPAPPPSRAGGRPAPRGARA